jgi:hypothetical protein
MFAHHNFSEGIRGDAKRRKAAGNYPELTSKPARGRAPSAEVQSEAVTWELLGDIAAHPMGQAVMDLLAELQEEHIDAGGNVMVTVLEGSERQPILRIKTAGLGTFMSLVGGMHDLDLTDRLENRHGPEHGVDAAFS